MRVAFTVFPLENDKAKKLTKCEIGLIPYHEVQHGGSRNPVVTLQWLKSKNGIEVKISSMRYEDIMNISTITTAVANIKKKSDEAYHHPLKFVYALMKKLGANVVWSESANQYKTVKRIQSETDNTKWSAIDKNDNILCTIVCGSDNEETIEKRLSAEFGHQISKTGDMSKMQAWLDNDKKAKKSSDVVDNISIVNFEELKVFGAVAEEAAE